jgi:hypothetical protein
MKRTIVSFVLLACAFLIPSLAGAAQIRAYVTEFTVTPPETGGLKSTLQTLLASRVASESITPVATAAEADVIISGNYTQIGRVFSLDAAAKLTSGRTLVTAYEQGESADDLIPALTKISAKLRTELAQRYTQAPAAQGAAPQAQPLPADSQAGSTVWLSQRIANAQMGVTPAGTRGGGREFFVAESHALRLYRQEKTLKLLAEVQLPLREKVIAIDSVGPDKNGNPRVYVSIMDGETPVSKIFSYENSQLKPVASKLPYLFRALALNGGKPRMYAQETGINDDYYGDIFEVSGEGAAIQKKNPIKLPRYGNIFNYSSFSGTDGKNYVALLSTDGYLIVYSDAGEELWRSTEKFGGSETYFQRDNGSSVKDTYEKFRWRFIDQRLTVTPTGEIIVPQNSGFFVLGNNRSYSKYSVVSFAWNGSSLDERWRSKQSQNYLADYYYEPDSREIVLLEVVQKEGLFTKGGSVVRVMSADAPPAK